MQKQESNFKTKDGLSIFYRSWQTKNPKATIMISHGYAEHSGRYDDFANFLVKNGFSIFALDHRGHGKSGGEAAHVDSFSQYVDDLHKFRQLVQEQISNPLYLLGHSMGGVIAGLYAIKFQSNLAGLILSSPYLKNAVKVPAIKLALAGLIAKVTPKLVVVPPLDANLVSHDQEIVEKYKNDPLNYTEGTKARMGSELINAGPMVLKDAGRINLPTLLLYGDDDKIADPEGSKELFEKLGAKDKTLSGYKGYYHEILNEVEREKVYMDILDWLDNHLSMD